MPLDALSASELTTGAPVLDNPALHQNHHFTVAGFTNPAPVLDAPAIGIDPSTLWPFPVNWRSPVSMSFEFMTSIITSRAAREQRRADRDQPRKKWSYDFSVYGTAFREKISQLTFRLGEEFLFADPLYRVDLAADYDVADPTASVVSAPAWLVADSYGVLVQGSQRMPVRVLSVVGTDVTFAGVNDTLWYAGARLYLAEPVRIADDSLKVSALTADVIEGKSDLDVRPDAVLYFGDGVAGEMYNGREVLLKRPNWASPVETDFLSGRAKVDYGQGRVEYFSPVPYVARDTSATFLGRSLEEIDYIIGFFYRMKGRRGEFYFPTEMADIKPATPLVIGGSTLRAEGRSYYLAFNNATFTDSSTVLKAMILFLADGSHLIRGIDSVSLSAGDSVFNLDDDWPANIPLSSIKKVCFLPVCRFGSDTLSIDLLTNSVGQFNLAIHALESLTPE